MITADRHISRIEKIATDIVRPLHDLPLPAGLRHRLTGFGQWWTGELLSMLPRAGVHSLAASTAHPVLQISTHAVSVSTIAADGTRRDRTTGPIEGSDPQAVKQAVTTALRRSRYARGSVLLAIPPGASLERTVTVPDSDNKTLRGLFTYDLDRWMPVTSDDALFSFKVITRTASTKTADVTLVCARPSALDAVRNVIPDMDRFAGFAHISETDGSIIPLTTPEQDTMAAKRRKQSRLISLTAVGLLIAGFAAPWAMLTMERDALEDRLQSVRIQARAAALQQKTAREADQIYAEAAERLFSMPPASVRMARLTAALPDDTWLDHLTVQTDNGRTTMEVKGVSANVPGVLDALDRETMFGAVQFGAPTSIIPETRNERFTITISLANADDETSPGEMP